MGFITVAIGAIGICLLIYYTVILMRGDRQ